MCCNKVEDNYGRYGFNYSDGEGKCVSVGFTAEDPTWREVLDNFQEFLQACGFKFKLDDTFVLCNGKSGKIADL